MKISHKAAVFAGLVLAVLAAGSAFGGTPILSDNYDVVPSGSGFGLNAGVNGGINPPTTRLTGTAAANLRYLATVATKPASQYVTVLVSGSNYRLKVAKDPATANIGRFTLSADGTTPFDFGPTLGTATATPGTPLMYDITIKMDNDASTTPKMSFGFATAEGDVDHMDFGVQLYKASSGASVSTIGKLIETNSSGVANIKDPTGTTVGLNSEVSLLMRVTDAGTESGANYNSRVRLSLDAGGTWFYDTDSDTALPNGWRFDGTGRFFMWDQAGNTSGDVFYDAFSVTALPVWTGAGSSDDNWSTSANWGGVTPTAAGDCLSFAGSTRLTPVMENNYTVNLLTFFSSAGSFVIGATEGKVMTLTGDVFQYSANPQTLNMPIVLSATRTITTTSGNIALGGLISGSGGITKAAANDITLSGANTYSGITKLSRGNLYFNSIANVGGGASALGAPATTANGTIAFGSGSAAALRYTGSGHTTDRVVNLAGTTGGVSIYASGTGPLVFSSGFNATGAGIKTLTLRGVNTGDNTIGGAIVNNSAGNTTALTKNDAGKWILGGASTYTGATTVTAGTLLVNGSLASGSAVSVAAAGTLGGAGTINGTVSVSGTLSAGAGVGKLTTGAITLNAGGTDLWEISNATGAAGAGWDYVDAGIKNIDIQATSSSKFTFKLVSLGLVNFNQDSAYSWPAINGTVLNFAVDKFAVDDSGFTNDLAGGSFFIAPGSLTVGFANNHPPVANPVSYSFSRGLPFKHFTIPIATLLAGYTSDPDGDARALVSLISTNATVSTNATDITISSDNGLAEDIQYVVCDVRNYRAGDTLRTATSCIHIARTNSVGPVTASNLGGTNMTMSYYGIPGCQYVIQRSPDMGIWSDVTTNAAAENGLFQFSELPPYSPAFYRVRSE
jgi:autotransporter-associated beta strand protein